MKLPPKWTRVMSTPALTRAAWYGRYSTLVAEYHNRAAEWRRDGNLECMRSSLRFARRQAGYARREYKELCALEGKS